MMRERAFQQTGYQNREIQVIPGDYYKPYQGAAELQRVSLQRQPGNTAHTYSGKILAGRRKERRGRRIRRMACGAAALLMLLALLPMAGNMLQQIRNGEGHLLEGLTEGAGRDCPEELLELLEKNEETYDFVAGYPDREKYLGKEIDLSGDLAGGDVPLLMQWDVRWGYDSYGEEMVGLAGCGPTCMAMAYL